jgi:hypothetical protein
LDVHIQSQADGPRDIGQGEAGAGILI